MTKLAISRLARSVLRRSGLTMRKKYLGQTISFDPSTDIGWILLLNKKFEREEIALCNKLISSDSVVLDVGANIGLLTIAFARAAEHGLVIAVEASPVTFAKLQSNTRGLSNVVGLNIGLSSESGLQEFFVASDDAYSGLKNTHRKKLLETIKIPCYRGDEVILPIVSRAIDLIKIDVEGAETGVIRGLKSVIKESRPVIFCEIFAGEASNPNVIETIETMQQMSYSAFVLVGSTLKEFVSHDDQFYNYFFIPSEKMTEYRMKLSIEDGV